MMAHRQLCEGGTICLFSDSPAGPTLSHVVCCRQRADCARLRTSGGRAAAIRFRDRRQSNESLVSRISNRATIASDLTQSSQPSQRNMITVGMNYHVIQGKQQDFEEKFAAVIGALNAADGHENSTLWKDVSDDASYLITSEWSDESAFSNFIQSPAFRDVTNWGKEQILSDRPRHKIYKS